MRNRWKLFHLSYYCGYCVSGSGVLQTARTGLGLCSGQQDLYEIQEPSGAVSTGHVYDAAHPAVSGLVEGQFRSEKSLT